MSSNNIKENIVDALPVILVIIGLLGGLFLGAMIF